MAAEALAAAVALLVLGILSMPGATDDAYAVALALGVVVLALVVVAVLIAAL